MATLITTLKRQERQHATTNKMQRNDIESLKKRLEQFGAENDDLLEKLAEMKRERAQRKREFDEQMNRVADELSQLKDSRDQQQPDDDQLRETRQQLEEARLSTNRLQQELDAERRRCAELERVNAELQSRLEDVQVQTTQSAKTGKSPVRDVQRKQQLDIQVRALTRELIETRQRLTDQADTKGNNRQKIKRLVHEKAELEEKSHELSLALDNLKRNNAATEQQKGLLLDELDKLKRALEACITTEEEQKKQLQIVGDEKQELKQLMEQMRAEQNGAKRIEKSLRDELEKMKQVENETAVKEVELKHQLAKAQEDFNSLSRKTQLDISRLKEESKRMNEADNKLKKVNLHLAMNERQLKAKLEEAKSDIESRQEKLQQEIDTLRRDLLASEKACIKLREERNDMLEKWIPKERLGKLETELKQMRKVMEETEKKIQKVQDEQDALQRKTKEREQELIQDIEKLRSKLKTKEEQLEQTEEEQLEQAAEQSLELENKNERLRESYDKKEKLFRKEHEKLEQTMKEQHNAYQEKIQATETQHLTEREQIWNEKEKKLKNKMKVMEFEIKSETANLKSKCEQLETTHEKKLRAKDEETKCRIKRLKLEIEQRDKMVEEANEKNKELQKIIDEHVSQTSELETLRSANDQLKEKVGKLERAVLRLRLDNDELREHKEQISKSENVKELVSERNTHVSDLQLQIGMLRQAIEDRSKPPRRLNAPPSDAAIQSSGVDHDGRLLEEMVQLLRTTAKDSKRQVSDSSTLARELEAERNKVRAGSDRIAQLEHWLDTIFNDQEFGIGSSAVRDSTEKTSQFTLPPVDGASSVPAVGKLKTQTTSSRRSDLFPNKQKQTGTRSKRQ